MSTELTTSEQVLTVAQFRADFSEFADETKHTEPALTNIIHQAFGFVSRQNSTYLNGSKRLLAIEYMAAHLKTLSDKAIDGSAGGIIGSSSVGDVSVSLIQPPIKKQFDYWCNQTIYGQSYLALLQTCAPAGMYIGGTCERVFR